MKKIVYTRISGLDEFLAEVFPGKEFDLTDMTHVGSTWRKLIETLQKVDVLFQKLLMNLLIWVLRMLDGIMDIFQQLAGVRSVDNEGNDLITLFLKNEGITKIFFGILIISVVVAAISIIVAIVKAFVNMGGQERKPIGKITGQGMASVFISLLMAGIMVSGITIANSLLRDVNSAFGIENRSEVCNELFDVAVDDGAYEMVPIYEYEQWYNPVTLQKENKRDANGNEIPVYLTDSEGNVMKDDSGNPIPKIAYYVKTPVYQKDEHGNNIKDVNNNPIPIGSGWTEEGIKAKGRNGWSILDENADTILGDYSSNWPHVFPDHTKQKSGLIYWGSFNFILGYFAAIVVLVAVASACLGLVKRLYDIVVLFLALPLISSTIPLDDGARFKIWRETVISKVILAYGAVFAVNTFIIMAPIIISLQITKIIKMILIVGGGLSISGGMLLFARIFGTDAAESREMAQSARTLLAGAGAGIAGIKGTFKGAKAGKNWLFGVDEKKDSEKRKDGALKRFAGFVSHPLNTMANSGVGKAVQGIYNGISSMFKPQSQPGSQLGKTLENAGHGGNGVGGLMKHSPLTKGLNKEKK